MQHTYKVFLIGLWWVMRLSPAVAAEAPVQWDEWFERAEAHKKSMRLDSALHWFDRLWYEAPPNYHRRPEVGFARYAVHLRMGNFAEVEALAGPVEALVRDQPARHADFLSSRAIYHRQQSRLEQAQRDLEEALRLMRTHAVDDDFLYSKIFTNYSNTYADQSRPWLTLQYLDSAFYYATRRDTLSSAPYLLLNRAIHYQHTDPEMALQCQRDAIALGTRMYSPQHPVVRLAYIGLAQHHFDAENYPEALHYLLRGLDGEDSLQAPLEELGHLHDCLGVTYLSMGNTDLALRHAQRAAEIIGQVHGPFFSKRITTMQNLMAVHAARGERAAGEAILTQLFKTARRLHDAQASTLAEVYAAEGEFYFQLGLYAESEAALQRALTYAPSPAQRIIIVRSLAEIWLEQARFTEALDLLQTIFAPPSATVNGGTAPYAYNPDLRPPQPRQWIELVGLKTQALWGYYQQTGDTNLLTLTHQTGQLALRAYDESRQSYRREMARGLLGTQNRYALIDVLVNVAALQYQRTGQSQWLAAAFAFAEQGKALSLREAGQDNRALAFADLPDSLLARERQLLGQLALGEDHYWQQMREDPQAKVLIEMNSRLLEQRAAHAQLLRYLETHYPDYYAHKYRDDFATLDEVQRWGRSGHITLVSYHLGASGNWAFVVGKQTHLVPLANEVSIEEASIRLRQALTQNQYGLYCETAHQLYQHLLAPLRPYLTTEQLCIVPDGPLHYVPFELLLTTAVSPQGTPRYGGLPYLLHDYVPFYQLSATQAIRPKQRVRLDTGHASALLGFAPHFEGDRSPAGTDLLAFRDTVRAGLQTLYGAAREVRAVQQFFPGQLFVREQATETNFKAWTGQPRILHLATHALVDDANPNFSRLVFAADDTLNDGLLHAYELYNLRLNAELVTLSACNTGFGQIQRGEGVMSLARAFAYAGCGSIVMSLWPAADQATADLMTYFYAELAQGTPKHIALRRAKLTYLQHTDALTANPYYWGGFVLMGDPEALTPVSGGYKPWGWAALLLIPLLGRLLFWRYRAGEPRSPVVAS